MTMPALTDWTELPTRRAILERIDRLDVSADVKLVLGRIANSVAEIGGKIIEVGRRILTFAFELLKTFPNVTFGVIMALVVSTLIASIPLLGGLLGPLLAPLLFAYGLTSGALQDIKDGALRRRVADLETEFRTVIA